MQIVLVHPRIPQNAGAVARLAAAYNARLILVRPLGFRVDGAEARRAAVDYWDLAEIKVVPDIAEALAEAEGTVYWLSRKGSHPLMDAPLATDDTYVFGDEEAGLPEAMLKAAPPESVLRIPIPNPAVRSLNLATAVAIVLHEATRRRELR